MEKVLRLPLICSVICTLLFLAIPTVYAEQSDEEALEVLESLKDLGLPGLGEVEISLDETFDIFDGLLSNKKVSIATGTKQFSDRAPSVTTVITAQDIEAMGARDLDEVLEAVPGLHVAREGIGYRPIYTIRGVYSTNNPEVLMLINGVPMKSLFSGDRGFVWGGMPVNAISRVEVIRGPGSAVYGADAFSGVINIITKTAEEIDGTEAGVRGGSFESREAWVLHGGKWADINVAFSLEYGTTDGDDSIIEEDLQTQLDRALGTSASLAPGSVNLGRDQIDARLDLSKDQWQMRLGYQERRNVGTGTGISSALDPTGGFYDADRFNADLTYHNPNLTKNWDFTTRLSFMRNAFKARRDNRLYPAGAFGGAYPDGLIGNPGTAETNTYFDMFGFYSGFKKHLIRIGAGYHYGDLYRTNESKNFDGFDPVLGIPAPLETVIDFSDTPSVFQPEGIRKDWYLSLQDTWRITSRWEFTAGIRYDRYSDFGSTVNPRLALVWDTTPTLTTKLLYGQAFRAPAFLELYNTNNPVQLGNPDLDAEQIETFELAFDYRVIKDLNLTLNLFHYEITDKILFVADPSGTNTAQNTGSQNGQGFELEARWKTSKKSSLLINYAYQDSEDKFSQSDAANAPRQQVYIRSDWLLNPKWYLDAKLNWVADRPRFASDLREEIDDYVTVDLTLRYKDINEGQTNFAFGIRNLFDEDAREPSLGPDSSGIVSIPYDLPLPGRHYFIEFRYKF